MSRPVVMECSRALPLPVEEVFDRVLPLPLERLFNRRYGPIPAIRSVEGPPGPWGTPGQARTIRLAGGGSMREELTDVTRPTVFRYMLEGIVGPMRLLVAHVEGQWRFESAGAGTRVTWQWTVKPAARATAPLLPALARAWRGYARQSLERMEELLLAG